jgi:hypothetical protein
MRLLCACLVVAAGCGGSLTKLQAGRAHPGDVVFGGEPFFVPGERAQLEMTWFGVSVAQVSYAAGESGAYEGRPAVVVRTGIRSAGLLAVVKKLRDEMTTVVDLGSGVPIASSGAFEALYRGRSEDVDPDRPRPVEPWRHGGEGRVVHDTLSTFLALRAWAPPKGARADFLGWIGASEYPVELVAGPTEVVAIPLGRFPARRIEGVVRAWRDFRFTLWLSDDADRALLRLEAETEFGGIVRLELQSYER